MHASFRAGCMGRLSVRAECSARGWRTQGHNPPGSRLQAFQPELTQSPQVLGQRHQIPWMNRGRSQANVRQTSRARAAKVSPRRGPRNALGPRRRHHKLAPPVASVNSCSQQFELRGGPGG